MAGLLRLSRPLNCVMSAVGVGIGGVVGVGSAAWGDFALPLVLAAAAAARPTTDPQPARAATPAWRE